MSRSGASLSTPAAIVLGLALAGAFAGVGLYFGLRARQAPAAAASSAETSGARTRVAPAPPIVGAPPANGATTVAATAGAPAPSKTVAPVVSDVARAIDAQHARLVHDCWEPVAKDTTQPARVGIVFMLGYDARGRLQTRGLRDADVMRARPDVTTCVDREIEIPNIPPPGTPARVDVTVTLP